MDNGTNPPHREYLKEYIAEGYVTYFYDRGFPIQTKFYNKCLNEFRRETRWLACVDSDEFIVLKQHANINEFLRQYERFAAIAISWYIFGTNGHREHQQSTISAYTRRMNTDLHLANPQSRFYHFKMIYQTDYTVGAGIHSGSYHTGYFAVDESQEKVAGDTPKVIKTDIIQLNHYAVRSVEDFETKMRRAAADGSWRRREFLETVERYATVEDRSIIERHYPELISKIAGDIPDIIS
jgi:hypothetical protein